MSSDWSQVSFEQVKAIGKSAFAMGPFGSNIKAENFTTSGVPVIKGGNLNGTYIDDNFTDFLTEEKASELASSQARHLDIVITHRGTLGQVGLIPENAKYPYYVVSQSQLKLSFDQAKVDPYFVYYFLRSPLGQQRLLANTSQVGVPAIAQALTTIRQIQISLPSLTAQHGICSILRSIDDRITLLRETNATLEAIAQALFKSWFVDFDPVRAKMEGRVPEGMDEATAALFPDALVESELGLVPEEWRVGQLGNEVKIAYGKNLPTNKLLETGYPVYGGNGRIGFFDKYLYESRQVLVACRGAASGKFNQSVPRSFVTNNSLVLESSDSSPLLFGYLKGCISSADLIPFVTGSAQPQVTIDNLKNLKLLVPSQPLIQKFESFSAPIEDSIEANDQQVQTLATLRDTLLPRLISGQMRLPETSALELTA